MKCYSRILSALTAAAMSFSLFASSIPTAAENEMTELATTANSLNDVHLQPSNPLGAMMLDAVESTDSGGGEDTGYAVSDIVIENGTADVSYYAASACDLAVGFYSDDEQTMYSVVTEHVVPSQNEEGGNDHLTFTVPDEVPEFYVVKGFLVGENYAPLCEAYSTTLYTEEITQIRNSVTSDFEPELVVNLDDSTETNFMVLNADTVNIPYVSGINVLDEFDDSTGQYTFSHIDSYIADLTEGAVVYYDYDGRRLTFKVKEITVNGETAVIQSDDMELTDAFSLVKIEETMYGEVEDASKNKTVKNQHKSTI